MTPLTAADRALAKKFAGSLERQPATRSIDELTEEDLLAIDVAYARDKASGALERKRDECAAEYERREFAARGFL